MNASPEDTGSVNPTRRYRQQMAVSLLISCGISLAFAALWQLQGWPFPFGALLTFFLFVSGVLQPTHPAARRQSWRARILLSLILAIVCGGAFTLIMRS